MAGKEPPGFDSKPPALQERLREMKAPVDRPLTSDSGMISPRVARNDYLERVEAAKAKDNPGAKSANTKSKDAADSDPSSRRQEALLKSAENEAERNRKAAEAKAQADVTAREKHLTSQINAWQRTLGQDSDTDARTRATIATLSRELANLKKK